MLDRYYEGNANRISPEAPVPAVRVINQFDRLGGAANVALNVKTLGADCVLMGIVASDDSGQSVEQLLKKFSIGNKLVIDKSGVTTQKLRVLSKGQQMIRLDFEQQAGVRAVEEIQNKFKEACRHCDVVILSDYAKGCLTHCQEIIKIAVSLGKPVIVDPKGNDFGKYSGATLITPNMAEFIAVVGEFQSTTKQNIDTNSEVDLEVAKRALILCNELQLKAVLVTRSEKGMSLIQKNAEPVHLPTAAREVFDVTGAGDTVVASLAVALGLGLSLKDSVELSNLAAGIAVGKVGTVPVSLDEIQSQFLIKHSTKSTEDKVVSNFDLIERINLFKRIGKVVVMTNGCFDILHPGHIDYLERARRQGDILIVALNSDDSVRRLKGEGRPVNSVSTRARMLGALSCVDLVTVFEEDTPENLISEALPNILVKGGDYKIDQIAGAKQVQANGGQVMVLDFLHGHSTSLLIERIKRDGC